MRDEALRVFRGRWSPLPPAIVWAAYGVLAVVAFATAAGMVLGKLGHDGWGRSLSQLPQLALPWLPLLLWFAIHPWLLGTRAVVLAADRIIVYRYRSSVTVPYEQVRCIRVSKRGTIELVYGTRVGKVTPPFSVEKPDELVGALQARCPQASVRRI